MLETLHFLPSDKCKGNERRIRKKNINKQIGTAQNAIHLMCFNGNICSGGVTWGKRRKNHPKLSYIVFSFDLFCIYYLYLINISNVAHAQQYVHNNFSEESEITKQKKKQQLLTKTINSTAYTIRKSSTPFRFIFSISFFHSFLPFALLDSFHAFSFIYFILNSFDVSYSPSPGIFCAGFLRVGSLCLAIVPILFISFWIFLIFHFALQSKAYCRMYGHAVNPAFHFIF